MAKHGPYLERQPAPVFHCCRDIKSDIVIVISELCIKTKTNANIFCLFERVVLRVVNVG